MRKSTFAVVLTCLGTIAGHAQEVSEFALASKIIALERARNRACEVKDLKVLDTLLDDAFVYVEADGKLMTKQEVLADVKKSNGVQVLTESMTVHSHGGTVVVTGIYRIRGAEGGRAFARSGRFVDTWLYRKGLWVSIASLGTPIGQ